MATIIEKILPYQNRILISDKKFNALIGGTGVGKTYFIPRYLLYKMTTHKGYEWIVSSPTIGMLKRNPWKYITTFFKQSGIKYSANKTEMTMETDFGIIYYISAETPDRMQGIHAKGIIGDEAGLYSRLWWDTALQRVSFQKGGVTLFTTPYGLNWLKTVFYDKWLSGDNDYHVENPKSIDNPFYPREEYERAKRELPDWKFKMLYDAQFTKPAGLIYTDYETVEPFDIPWNWIKYRSLDFGVNNPFGCLWFAENPDTEETYIIKEYKQSGMDIDQIHNLLKDERDIITYGDPENKEVMLTLKRRGLRIRESKKDVIAGILATTSELKTGKLKLFNNLKNLKDELSMYQWQTDKSDNILDKPKKEHDHLCDALRYFVFTRNNTKSSDNFYIGTTGTRESNIFNKF